MDPLSVAASVVGLVVAAEQLKSLLKEFISGLKDAPSLVKYVMSEVHSITSVFWSLDAFLAGDRQALKSREALIMVNDLVITLTGCVCTFSELENEIKGLKSDNNMNFLDRFKWASRKDSITQIFDRLQNHKSSLTLMLTVLQCKSDAKAGKAMDKLCILVTQLIESNKDISERLSRIETGSAQVVSIPQPADSVISPSHPLQKTWSQATTITNKKPTFIFESALWASKVYRRTLSASKRSSLHIPSESQSIRSSSGLSLSEVSNIQAVNLPIFSRDISNSQCYTFGDVDHAALVEKKRKMKQERLEFYILVAAAGGN